MNEFLYNILNVKRFERTLTQGYHFTEMQIFNLFDIKYRKLLFSSQLMFFLLFECKNTKYAFYT